MSAAIKLLPSADPRARAVAKFRELADRLESGELRGARIEWREDLGYYRVVELDEINRQARLYDVEV